MLKTVTTFIACFATFLTFAQQYEAVSLYSGGKLFNSTSNAQYLNGQNKDVIELTIPAHTVQLNYTITQSATGLPGPTQLFDAIAGSLSGFEGMAAKALVNVSGAYIGNTDGATLNLVMYLDRNCATAYALSQQYKCPPDVKNERVTQGTFEIPVTGIYTPTPIYLFLQNTSMATAANVYIEVVAIVQH